MNHLKVRSLPYGSVCYIARARNGVAYSVLTPLAFQNKQDKLSRVSLYEAIKENPAFRQSLIKGEVVVIEGDISRVRLG